jgi:DNA polymerase I-like protein with 3'-5' exonuclease and polymerase domains
MTKKAMVTLFKEMSLTPLVQVHDELDLSLPLGDDDLVGDIASRMENCVDLVVPVVCDVSTGKNWGEAK